MPHPTAADLHALLSDLAGADADTVARALVSPSPTPHVVTRADGTERFTWCALDGLIVAHLWGCDLRLRSTPPWPAGHAPLELAVRGGRVACDPAYVLSFPHVSGADGVHFTEAFCPYANLFPSAADHAAWAMTQPRPTTPLPVRAADEIARVYAADAHAAARGASGPAARAALEPLPA